jgi:hypothetical protein
MPLRSFVTLSMLLAVAVASAQTMPASNPASAPAPKPIVTQAPPPVPQTVAPVAPVPSSPIAAPVQPQSDAGATERGLAPVKPAHGGVTQRVRDANTHDADPQGHTLDPHGKPVGQAPAPSTTVR